MRPLKRREPRVRLRASRSNGPGRACPAGLAAILLLLSMTTGTALAQQELPIEVEDVIEAAAPANPEGKPGNDPDLEADDGEAPAKPEVDAEINQAEGVFNYWMRMIESSAPILRRQLEQGLALRVNYIEQTCGISPAQKRKLELSGRGDIERHFKLVEEKKVLFRRFLKDEAKRSQITSDLQALTYRSPLEVFDAKSIFGKTTKAILSPEQYRRYEEGLKAREEFQIRAALEQAISVLDAAIGLDDEQRGQFLSLFRKHADQLKQVDVDFKDPMSLVSQAWRLPEASVKAILDDEQWHLMEHFRRQTRENYGGGGPGLEMLTEKGVDPAVILRPAGRDVVHANEGPNRPPCGAESLP
ncbi:hypothetical protein [Singulisphaera sp. PoT]|uniref:hypothetical protein n=1 Tax=Singulisphaera sp. PoT TaxID=3411797 RepID=UPI003BF4FCA7